MSFTPIIVPRKWKIVDLISPYWILPALCFLSKLFLKVAHYSNVCPFFLQKGKYLGYFKYVIKERNSTYCKRMKLRLTVASKELQLSSLCMEKVEGHVIVWCNFLLSIVRHFLELDALAPLFFCTSRLLASSSPLI